MPSSAATFFSVRQLATLLLALALAMFVDARQLRAAEPGPASPPPTEDRALPDKPEKPRTEASGPATESATVPEAPPQISAPPAEPSQPAESRIAGPPGAAKLLSAIEEFVLKHAPNKQVTPAGVSNPKIGRTPASGCEVMRYLTMAIETGRAGPAARDKLHTLAEWIIGLQVQSPNSPTNGGVASTPDLKPPANSYYYSIDAAVCGDAMLRTYQITKNDKHLLSAQRFADFLLAMHRGQARAQPSGKYGFCEAVAVVNGRLAWNCDIYTKNLVALPLLSRIAEVTGQPKYAQVARDAREFLLPGLTGLWEYATAASAQACTAKSCKLVWKRVQGPHREPDHFVYGDTIAYGLRGLFEAEGASADVTALYKKVAAFKSDHERARNYDGRIAFAGYIIASKQEPDHFSAYYDLVTIGVLHGLRKAVAPEDFTLAGKTLGGLTSDVSRLAWRMNFDGTLPEAEYVDLTTLANLGEALLLER